MSRSSKGNSKRGGREHSKHTNFCMKALWSHSSKRPYKREKKKKKKVAGTQPSRDGSHKLRPDHCSGLGNNEHYVLLGSGA